VHDVEEDACASIFICLRAGVARRSAVGQMADASDSDDDDLFADFEKSTCEDLNVSANLISDLGHNAVAQKSLDKRDERAPPGCVPV
jgi:hypothetical protein